MVLPRLDDMQLSVSKAWQLLAMIYHHHRIVRNGSVRGVTFRRTPVQIRVDIPLIPPLAVERFYSLFSLNQSVYRDGLSRKTDYESHPHSLLMVSPNVSRPLSFLPARIAFSLS